MTYYNLYLNFLKKYNQQDNLNITNDFFSLIFQYSKDVKNLADFYMLKNNQLNLKIEINQFIKYIKKIGKHKVPVALITRSRYFYGNKLYLRKGALIPRSETELLVDKIILENYKPNLKILDLASGTGNIGLTLAKNLKAKVTLVEKYNIPYAILLKNKQILKLSKNVNIKHMDIKRFLLVNNKKFDLIVMNPPYISFNDNLIEDNVKKFEPNSALYSIHNGLYFYKLVLNFIPYLMNKKTIIYFEIGQNQKESLVRIINNLWWKNIFEVNYEFSKDYNNFDRFLKIIVTEK